MLKRTLEIIRYVIANREALTDLLYAAQGLGDVFDGEFNASVVVHPDGESLFSLKWINDKGGEEFINDSIPDEYVVALQNVAKML